MPKVTQHPGISLVDRGAKARADGKTPKREGWMAKYVDPDSGKMKNEDLDALGLKSAKARKQWAKSKSKEIAARRAELAGGAQRRGETTVKDATKEFRKWATQEKRPATARSYGQSVDIFEAWPGTKALGTIEELDRAGLRSFRDWVAARPKRVPVKAAKRGTKAFSNEKRSPAGVNHHLRELKAMFNDLRARGLLPRVDRDAIRDALKPVTAPKPNPEPLEGDEPRKLLLAALRHDVERDENRGEGPRFEPVAPFVAFVLLTGCRLGEALALEKSDMHLDAPGEDGTPAGEIRLKPTAVKTKTARRVDLDVSPGLRKILAAVTLAARAGPYVFNGLKAMPRARAEAARKRLVRSYGAPAFDWQKLRQTCASFLTNAPGIFSAASIYRSAEQLGHSPQVASRHYLGRIRGIPATAKTLDAAMKIEDALDLVRRSVSGERVEVPAVETKVA